MKKTWSLKNFFSLHFYLLFFISLLFSFIFAFHFMLSAFRINLAQLKKTIVISLKEQTINEVNSVVDILDLLNTQKIPNKQKILQTYIQNHRWNKNENYVFVYKLLNIKGGKKFAIMFANPNRPDLIGKFVSDDYLDVKGTPFRKLMLEKIRQKGEGFVSYWYKPLNGTKPQKKTSYFKLDKSHRYIVASGFYEPSLVNIINHTKSLLIKKIRNIFLLLMSVVFLFLVMIFIIITRLTRKISLEIEKFNTLIRLTMKNQEDLLPSYFLFKEFADQYQNIKMLLAERKQNINKLYKEKEQLDITLSNINEGVIVVNERDRIILVNKKAENITQFQYKEMLGEEIEKILLVSAKNPEFFSDIKRSIGNKKATVQRNKIVFRSKHKKEYIVNISATNLFDSDNVYRGVLFVFQDITDELKKMQILDRTQKLESLGLLAGGIAHDFNNILAGILGNISLAKLELPQKSQTVQLLTTAEKAAYRARHLTNLLLTFSRGGNPVRTVCSLQDIIYDAVELILSGSSIYWHYDVEDDLYAVEIDQGQITQVIQNILINAKEAMPEGGRIDIQCRNINHASGLTHYSFLPQGRFIELCIRDSGPGISPENINHIFDPYFTTKDHGNGLGLSICHSVIQKHKGYIFVKSNLGEGTEFFIYLPATTKLQTAVSKNHPKSLSRYRILVMDDEPIIRDVAKKLLEKMQHTVTVVSDGKEAVSAYQEAFNSHSPYDLVILDLTVKGGMGGKEAMEKILEINPDALGIASSGYTEENVSLQSLFKKFLQKPYKKEDLEQIIHDVLSE